MTQESKASDGGGHTWVGCVSRVGSSTVVGVVVIARWDVPGSVGLEHTNGGSPRE